MRSQDKKATRRVNVMLKRTKSANKSVIEDAVDNDNTAVTLAGPSQPDEDDYGYVSQEASAFYNKMMAKYNNMPEEPKLFSSSKKSVNTNLSSTKDRVRAALLKEQEEALLPHRRKRKSKHDDEEDTHKSSDMYRDDINEEKEETKPKPKPRPAGPPPMNFQDLLKLAEKKQFEPILIEPKKKDDDEPLMTKRQKREYEKEKTYKEEREKRRQAMESEKNAPPNKIPKLNNNNGKIPKSNSVERYKNEQKSGSNNIKRQTNIPERNIKPDINKSSKLRTELEKYKERSRESISQSSQNRSLNKPLEKQKDGYRTPDNRKPRPDSRNIDISKSKSSTSGNVKMKSDTNSKLEDTSRQLNKQKQLPPSNARPKLDGSPKQTNNGRPKQFPSSDLRPKQFPPSDVRPKQFPPSDLKPKKFPPSDVRPKQFPAPDVRPKQFPPPDVRRRPPQKKPPMANKSKFFILM